jgi:hypothetical protein
MLKIGEDAEHSGGLPSCPVVLYRTTQSLYRSPEGAVRSLRVMTCSGVEGPGP